VNDDGFHGFLPANDVDSVASSTPAHATVENSMLTGRPAQRKLAR
jgi:hypothetical protein